MAWASLTYKITGLKLKDVINDDGETLNDAVFQTYWTLTGVDENGNEAEFRGALPLSADSVPASAFTAFSDVTEAQVIGWIEDFYDENQDFYNNMIAELQKQVDRMSETELSSTQLPWFNPEEIVEANTAPEEG
jgi:hypothetical protein